MGSFWTPRNWRSTLNRSDVLVTAALLFLAGSAVGDDLPHPESLIIDGAPNIPAELAREVGRYTKGRSAIFLGWHPTRRELLMNTRFGETLQTHRLRAPGGARTQLTFFDDDVTRDVAYESTGASILFSKDRGGDGNDQIYRMDAASGAITLVTDGRSRNVGGIWANAGGRIVYTSTRRNGRDTDLYVVEPAKPSTDRMLVQLEGSGWKPLDWSPDDARILVQQNLSVSQITLWLVDARSGAMTAVTTSGGYAFGAFGGNGKRVITTSDADSEFRELVSIDLESRKITRLSKHIPWDVIELDLSPDGRRAAIVANEAGVYKLHIIDVTNGREQRLPSLPPGWVTEVHWHRNGHELGFSLDSSRAPTDIYSLNLTSGKVDRWTESETGGVDLSTFSEPRLIEWPSFDERRISGFLYMPPPRFEGKRPVLISIHGGPEDQFAPYFLGRWNYLLNELGIALLYPNVRGSSGFGKTFLALDDGRKREGALRDIGALLDWIATQPQLDGTRVAVTGTSYGGFMSLSTAVRYNDRIRAAIDIVGPSDLVSFLEHTAEWRRDLRRVEYGDERDPAMREFLESIAPLRHADRIHRPLLVVQGANDPAVSVREAEQIVERVRKNGTPVWYLLGKDEGHGFRKRSNADYQFALTVLFLRRYVLE